MNRYTSRVLILLGVAVFLFYQSIFIVNQTEQALVLQFGDIRRVEKEPGLKFKVPFVQNVMIFDKRLMMFNVPANEMNAKDEALNITERVVIDAYVVYRINDPLRFYQAVRNEEGLATQLTSIVQSSLRKTVGSVSLRDLLSAKRKQIMEEVRDAINRKASSQAVVDAADDADAAEAAAANPNAAKPATAQVANTDVDSEKAGSAERGFGIEVVDVRIMHADLPQEVSQSTFERMRSDFEKEAQKFRAEGEERSLQIRSNSERERTELLATAMRKAEVIRGEGDGIATKTYADAFSKDAEFFDFYRSMQAYKKAMGQGKDTTVILSPGNDFLRHMED